MAGNVAEWVSDWYDAGYYGSSPESDPTGPDSGTERVLRGGHFSAPLAGIRTFARAASDPSEALPVFGFRCAYSTSGDGGTDTDTSDTSTGSTDTGTTETGASQTDSTSSTPSDTSTGSTATGETTTTP
jgi:hypothetical protein